MRTNRCGGLDYDRDGGEKGCLASSERFCDECQGGYCQEHWSETWEKCLGCLGVNHKDEVPARCQGCGGELDPDLAGHCPGCGS